ncbi:MAG: hypothetical protein NXH83_04960 [Rhodobacteraceae bacterium]|nr:hypothetical protein [Paracoccaceae bacterium]
MVILITLVVYLSAVALPRGRPAAIGIGVALAAGTLIWAAIPGGAAGGTSLYHLYLVLAGIGLAMAAVAQALRLILPRDGPLTRAYPAIILTVAVLAPMIARRFLE